MQKASFTLRAQGEEEGYLCCPHYAETNKWMQAGNYLPKSKQQAMEITEAKQMTERDDYSTEANVCIILYPDDLPEFGLWFVPHKSMCCKFSPQCSMLRSDGTLMSQGPRQRQ